MKKYNLIVLSFFLISLFSFYRVEAIVKDYSLLGKTIYLDAGHGGVDSGAVSGNILEKDINLEIVKKLEAELLSRGALVLLTRDGDYDLSTTTNNRKRDDLYSRVRLINSSNCDLYISIHLNSTTSSTWKGLQVFYSTINSHNKDLASSITNSLSKNISNVRKFKKSNSYYMYKNITIPGVLIETGFLSNPNDKYLLRQEDYQAKLASNITEGIINYFQNN